MKAITDLTTTQVRLFEQDSIPIRALRSQSSIDALQERYAFSRVGETPTQEVAAESGAFARESKAPLVIERISVNTRRIISSAAGETSDLDEFNEAFLSFILSVSATDDEALRPTPIFVAHETTCVVTLDFPYRRLLSAALSSCLTEVAVPAFSSDNATARLKSMDLSFDFEYELKNQHIREHGINLSEKTFRIEPRKSAPLSEQRFFVASPLDTESHLRLLRQIEEQLSA